LRLDTGGSTEHLRIDSSGRVGIGTSSPNAVLTTDPASGNFNATYNDYDGVGLFIRGNGTSGNGNYGPALAFGSCDSDTVNQDEKHGAISIVQTGTDPNETGLAFWTHPSNTSTDSLVEKLRIDSSGNVGIGTTSPTDHNSFTRIVDINGSGGGALYCRTNGNSTNVGIFGQSGSDVYVINKASGNIRFNVADAEKMRIDSSGNVGIGTTSINDNYGTNVNIHSTATDGARLKISDGTSGNGNADGLDIIHTGGIGYIIQRENNPLIYYTNNTEAMRLDSSGRLLIGGTSAISGSSTNDNLQLINSAGSILSIASSDTTIGDGTRIGEIEFWGQPNSTWGKFAGISAFGDGTAGGVNGNPGRLVFYTESVGSDGGPVERMRITSAGNPRFGSLEASGDAFKLKAFSGNSSHNATMQFFTGADSPTERMRITSGGNVLFNCTSLPSASVQGFLITGTSSGNTSSSGSSTTAYNHFLFYNGNGVVGSISTSGSTTTYSTSSDYRLKENVVDLDGAITRVKQLAPKRFNFIADDTATVDGFLAHEAQTVVPEAVTGTHNEVDDDGNAVMQGIDQSKLVPLLTAALKEAIAKIETLEAKVAALEAG
jgi:hypothetical protein